MTFPDLLTLRRIRFRRSHGDSAELSLCCPFCTDRGKDPDDKFHFGVNYVTGEGHCFRCGWRSRKWAVQAFLRKIGSSDEVEGLPQDEAEVKPIKIALPDDFEVLTPNDATDDMIGPAWRYLMKRGISEKQIQRNSIGISLTGRYAYRIVFPVRFQKKLKGFVSRDWTGTAQVRYLNSIGEKSLYNLREPSPSRHVILSEGIFKCLRIERATLTRSAAILGNTITDEQIQQLLQLQYQHAILWPDPNEAGIRGMLNTADRLSEYGIRVSTIYPIPSVEADELAVPNLKEIYLHRVRPLDWARRMTILAKAAFPA
jgi:hypothetical protein